MMTIQLDTLKIAQQLEEAGCSPALAKVQTAVLADAIAFEAEWAEERFAAKPAFVQEVSGLRSEMGLLRQELHTEISLVRQETNSLRHEVKVMIAETKSELIRWVVSIGIAQLVLISGLLFKLIH